MARLVSLVFWLILIPFCIGLVPVNFIKPSRRNPGLVFLAGYFVMWALFEAVCIPAVLWVKYHNFSVASNLFTLLTILCAIAGIFLWRRSRREGRESLIFGGQYDREEERASKRRVRGVAAVWQKLQSRADKIEWLIFLGLVGFQLYKAAAYTSFDGDDAYYVVESLIAQQADTMYRILPYTGRPTDLDIRHALAVFPMWVAYIAVRSDIHATIVSHLIMPFVLIPLSYLVYYEIGRQLFGQKEDTNRYKITGERERDNKETLPIFMIVMALFQMFGNVSIYTGETFFLTRTWQGKAVAASVVIPAILWLFLCIYDEIRMENQADAGLWLLFVCVNMTAGICSSIAIFLVSVLVAVTAFVLTIARRNIKVLLQFGAACTPNLIYMGLYVALGHGYLY